MTASLNGRFLLRSVTGVERYATEIMIQLGARLRRVQPQSTANGLAGALWEQVSLPKHIHPGEVLWSPANTGPLAVTDQVLTLHDLSPLEHPDWFRPAFALWYRLLIPRLVQRVKHVVVPSEYVRSSVLQRFGFSPERVTVVPGGVDLQKFRPAARNGAGTLPGEYVLYLGTLQPRKDLNSLLQAWQLIEAEFPQVNLVIAGSQGKAFARKAQIQGGERLFLPGYIPEERLAGLVASAVVLILPSLDEGFGLPTLEAMACGTPVIATQAGALPELVNGVGLLFKPGDFQALAQTLRRCLSEPDLRQTLVEAGLQQAKRFSWHDSAERMWSVIEACL